MGVRVGILRTTPELYGEIDRYWAKYGVVCDSLPPGQILTVLDQELSYQYIFIPLSCFDENVDESGMREIDQKIISKSTHPVWVMNSTDRDSFQHVLQTIITTDELEIFIDKCQPSASNESVSPSSLLKKFKNWVESTGEEQPAAQTSFGGTKAQTYYSRPADDNDIETLREYIRLKEEEVSDLKTQISIFEGENQKALKEIEFLKNEKNVQERKVDMLRGRVLFLEEENEGLRRQKTQELDSLRSEYKNKLERLAVAENTLREQELKFDDLRERVRRDLFGIQERERYLEARMEVLKRDTEILLHHKDEKIVELMEQIKQLEFKTEAYQEALQRFKEADREEQDRSKRIVRALKLATSLLDQEEGQPKDGDIRKREA